MLYICVREVHSSNLDRITWYPEWVFVVAFLSLSSESCALKYVTIDSFEIKENIENTEMYKGKKRDKKWMKNIEWNKGIEHERRG
jgi:hypothetical protein